MHRIEDERLLTGRGRFTDDLVADGALWGAFLRSPHAHAEVGGIDRVAAMAVPGATLLLDGEDVAKAGLKPIPVQQRLTDANGKPPREAPWPALACRRARHVGECVALCVADSAAAALAMVEALSVEFRPLPVIADVQLATKPGAPELWPSAPRNVAFEWGLGDKAATEAALAASAHVVEVELFSQRLVVCTMEPRAAIARYDAAEGTYYIHAGNQGMTTLRDQLATMLGVKNEAVVVTSFDVGGGFGMKNNAYPEYAALLHAAKLTGRPVRWTSTRSEAFGSDAQARDSLMRGRMGLDADGRIVALEAKSTAALGAYVQPNGYFIACANFAKCVPGPYRIAAVRCDVTCVMTNTVPTAPYRGAGRPEAAYLTERLIEAAARKLKLDPVEIRRRNLLPASAMPHKTAVGMNYCSGDFPSLLDVALKASDWTGAAARKAEAKARGKLRGIGLGMFVEIAGGAPTERAKLALDSDGIVHVRTAIGATGQGHQTVFAMLAAEQFAIPRERIRVAEGDSRGFVDGGSATAARSTMMAGMAIRATAQQLIGKAKVLAAERLNCSADDLVYEAGRFSKPGTNLALGLNEIIAKGEPPLQAEAKIEGEPTFPAGAHIAEAEIDPDTGHVTLIAYTAVDDSGRIIAEHFAEGQIHGGLAQGIGQALMEHGYYDTETGQLIAGSFMDYAVPRADNLPTFKSILKPSPATSNPLGVKGAGESGTVGALPTIANAIIDALSPLGVTEIALPATSERVWRTIETAKARRA